jgi:6-pyruvoyltetrahydropterin/6-carboxytetrahydropterin synthase
MGRGDNPRPIPLLGFIMRIYRKFEFDSAHRVLHHESKCKHLHGHRYVAEVAVSAPDLDKLGRVIDFSVIKKLVGDWINDNWDHNILLNSQDILAQLYHPVNIGICSDKSDELFAGKAPFLFINENPTAEVMAKTLFLAAKKVIESAHPDIRVQKVRLYETPNCWADFVRTYLYNKGVV